MKKSTALVLGAAALVALTARRASAPAGRVHMRERANGVLQPLHELLDAWEAQGLHDVIIAPYGGLRSSSEDQAELAALGMSAASNLSTTPHGRAAALDVWPVSFLACVPQSWGGTRSTWASWEQVPDPVKLEFAVFGHFAEARGFVWGGRWRSSTYPNGDQPHVEIKNWRSLPFPPQPQVIA